MNILVEFSLKKKSETENLNQDAYQIGTNGTFAIADGVSSAPFSEIWSDLTLRGGFYY